MQTGNVSVVGMGRLGVCFAAILAERGFSVIGVDLDAELAARINAGHAPCDEPGLQEMLTAGRARLRVTADYGEAVASSDISVILVGTPAGPDGVMSPAHVKQAAQSIGRALRHKAAPHLVILRSTVLPGVIEGEILPALEEASGKSCGVDFDFCYVPEFVAVGAVIRDMLNPALVVVGEHNPGAWPLIREFYDRCLSNTPPFYRMNLVNAELAKITLNAYVAAKIGLVNLLAELCERIPGADVDTITRAVGSDPRIGRKAFTGGPGFGGPCFVKDIKSFRALLAGAGVSPAIFEAVDLHNESIVHRLLGQVNALLEERCGGDRAGAKVAILGMAFKPGVSVVAHSPGIGLARLLAAQSCKVIVHDPLALDEARKVLGDSVEYAADIDECLRVAGVAVFVTPEPCYSGLQPDYFESLPGAPAIIDCWRLFGFLKNAKNLRYLPLGVSVAGFSTPSAEPIRNTPSQCLD